jgi:Spy/CpxP family protein refolding chaperone
MKLRSKWTLGLASLAVAATGSFMAASAQSPSPQTPPPQNKPDSKPDKKPEEKHPRLQKAIEELREVKTHLEKAPHDFGGHKADAIKSVTEAIKQLEAAVKFDK